jgi:hypothetical protein
MEEGVMTRDDPLLSALADAAQRKRQADHEIRLLLAWAREISTPRPYRLADLADATGMSISGIRVAYTKVDVVFAAHLTSGGGGPNLAAISIHYSLLARYADLRKRQPAA